MYTDTTIYGTCEVFRIKDIIITNNITESYYLGIHHHRIIDWDRPSHQLFYILIINFFSPTSDPNFKAPVLCTVYIVL